MVVPAWDSQAPWELGFPKSRNQIIPLSHCPLPLRTLPVLALHDLNPAIALGSNPCDPASDSGVICAANGNVV